MMELKHEVWVAGKRASIDHVLIYIYFLIIPVLTSYDHISDHMFIDMIYSIDLEFSVPVLLIILSSL